MGYRKTAKKQYGLRIRRRGPTEVIVNILREAKGGANKSRIVFGTNTNFAMVQKYLPFLEEKGLVRSEGKIIETTEKGKKVLQNWQEIERTVYR